MAVVRCEAQLQPFLQQLHRGHGSQTQTQRAPSSSHSLQLLPFSIHLALGFPPLSDHGFLTFLMQNGIGELGMHDKCCLVSELMPRLSSVFLKDAYQDLTEQENSSFQQNLVENALLSCNQTKENSLLQSHNENMAMVGLNSMQKANSTLEDFLDKMNEKLLFHTAVTASDSVYNTWQCRIMYYWFKQLRDTPDSAMGGFTRILHFGKPDPFMDEIPTFVAQPLLPGTDQGYIVRNRPWAFVQWLRQADIKEDYILMADAKTRYTILFAWQSYIMLEVMAWILKDQQEAPNTTKIAKLKQFFFNLPEIIR